MDTAYIKLLAQNTSTDISGWDLQKVFGRTTDRLITNKKFFAYAKKAVPASTVEQEVVVPKVITSHSLAIKTVSKMETTLRRAQKRAQMLGEKIAATQKDIVDTTDRIIQAKGGSVESVIEEKVKAIIKDGFWECPIFEDKYLYLNTKNDVIMHQTDKTKQSLNFGRFGARIDLQNLGLSLLAYENNLIDDQGFNCIHPYCFRAQDMCFGNATNMLFKMRRYLDLPGMMRLLAALLTTYDNTSHPVVRFETFKQDYKLVYPQYCKDHSYSLNTLHPMVRKKYYP
jgi:hypothetical protein